MTPSTSTPTPTRRKVRSPQRRAALIENASAEMSVFLRSGHTVHAAHIAIDAADLLDIEEAVARIDAFTDSEWDLITRVVRAQELLGVVGKKTPRTALEVALVPDPAGAVAMMGARMGLWPGNRWQPRTQPNPGRIGIFIQAARGEVAVGRRQLRFQLDVAGLRALHQMCAGGPAWRRPRLSEAIWGGGHSTRSDLLTELQLVGPFGPVVLEGITPLDADMRCRIERPMGHHEPVTRLDAGGWRTVSHHDEDEPAPAAPDRRARLTLDELFTPTWDTCDHDGAAWMGWGDWTALGCSRCQEALIHPVPRHALPEGHRRRGYLDAAGAEGDIARAVYAQRWRAREVLLTGTDPGTSFMDLSRSAAGVLVAEPGAHAGKAPVRSVLDLIA